jgi:hypothetical protein
MCARYMGAHVGHGIWSTNGMRKRYKKLDSRAAKKGVKKLVGSDFVEMLEKESSDKD